MKKNQKLLLCRACVLSFVFFLQLDLSAQNTFPATGNVGIGTAAPAAAALLEVKSTTKGVLIPRMTQAQRDVIVVSAMVNGLLIYQTNNLPGFYYYNNGWVPIAANLTLSNLSATTLINANLTPGVTNSITLGTTTKRWKNIHTYAINFADGTTQSSAASTAWKSSGANVFFNTGNAGIGTAAPATSAILDIKSTTKGILIPRMTQAQRDLITVSAGVNGLLIYQTNNLPGFYYYNNGWVPIAANLNLSNLSATTLINANLTPGISNSLTLGTTTKRWKNIYTYTITFPDGTTQSTAASASSQWKSSSGGIYFNSGMVGIGTSTPRPGFALTVGSFSSGGAIYINDPVDGNLALGTKSGETGEGFRMNISSTTNPNAAIRGHTDGNGFGVLAEATGSIGFGAEAYSSQSYGLWAGTGDATTYAAFFSGDVFCSRNYVGSDEKLKKNIGEFSGAIDIITRLHPKSYQYRQDGSYQLMNLPGGDHYGLVAQDVEKILPNLVKDTKFYPAKAVPSEGENLENTEVINFKALNYTELIPILIKGMQEQQQEIDQLQQTVQTLLDKLQTSGTATNLNGAYLLQNAPNPFARTTLVRCYVPVSVKQAKLSVYNLNGQLIKSITLTSGINNVNIAANNLAAGEYSYSLVADGQTADTKKMTIAR